MIDKTPENWDDGTVAKARPVNNLELSQFRETKQEYIEFTAPVTIRCHPDGVHCGGCFWCGNDRSDDVCAILGKRLSWNDGYLRCQACVDAERQDNG